MRPAIRVWNSDLNAPHTLLPMADLADAVVWEGIIRAGCPGEPVYITVEDDHNEAAPDGFGEDEAEKAVAL